MRTNWQWQLSPSWYNALTWLPHYRRYPDYFGPTIVVACIGPLQFRWFEAQTKADEKELETTNGH